MQATDRLEGVEPAVVPVPVPPLGLLGSVGVTVVGLVVAVIAVTVATGAAGSGTYRAQALVAIALPETGGNAGLATLMAGGAPTKAATAVLVDRDVATRATADITGSPSIAAVATPQMITVTVTANSAAAAERVAQSVVDVGLPAAAPLVGPLRLAEIGYPAGTAVAAGWSAGMVIAVTAPVAFLLGLLLALVSRWGLHRRATRAGAL